MNSIIQKDKLPPIINTIGIDGIYEELSRSATRIAYFSSEIIKNGEQRDLVEQLEVSYNKMLLCMGYLNIVPDELKQMMLLNNWHLELGDNRQNKFLPADWMAIDKKS